MAEEQPEWAKSYYGLENKVTDPNGISWIRCFKSGQPTMKWWRLPIKISDTNYDPKDEPPAEYRIVKRGGMFMIQTRYYDPARTQQKIAEGDGFFDIPNIVTHTTLPSARRHKKRMMAGDYTQPFKVIE